MQIVWANGHVRATHADSIDLTGKYPADNVIIRTNLQPVFTDGGDGFNSGRNFAPPGEQDPAFASETKLTWNPTTELWELDQAARDYWNAKHQRRPTALSRMEAFLALPAIAACDNLADVDAFIDNQISIPTDLASVQQSIEEIRRAIAKLLWAEINNARADNADRDTIFPD